MNLLILTPTYFPEVTGNAIDLARITAGLESIVDDIMIVKPDNLEHEKIRQFNPSVIHGIHAYKSRSGVALSRELGIPLVITMGGTDYNQCLYYPEKREDTLNTMSHASVLIFLTSDALKEVLERYSQFRSKSYAVAQGPPLLTDSDFRFRETYNIKAKDFVFTLIAGIRPVKNNAFPVEGLKELHEQYGNVKLVFVGPILDDKYWEQLKDQIGGLDWIKYLGTIDYKDIKQVFLESDVMLNCSKSEGKGNVVIEAMYLGRPVLASDIPANRSLIIDGENGMLYNPDEFHEKAKRLYENENLRRQIGLNASRHAASFFNPNEARDYLRIYTKVIRK